MSRHWKLTVHQCVLEYVGLHSLDSSLATVSVRTNIISSVLVT